MIVIVVFSFFPFFLFARRFLRRGRCTGLLLALFEQCRGHLAAQVRFERARDAAVQLGAAGAHAAVRHEDPPLFGRTHPDAEARASYLRSLVNATYVAPDNGKLADRKLLDILNNNYELLMEDQLDTNRFGRTQDLLERHAAQAILVVGATGTARVACLTEHTARHTHTHTHTHTHSGLAQHARARAHCRCCG